MSTTVFATRFDPYVGRPQAYMNIWYTLFVFICVLFNDDISNLENTASRSKMINVLWIRTMRKEVIVAYLQSLFLRSSGGIEENYVKLRGSWYPGRDSKRGLPNTVQKCYPLTHPTCSVTRCALVLSCNANLPRFVQHILCFTEIACINLKKVAGKNALETRVHYIIEYSLSSPMLLCVVTENFRPHFCESQ